MQFASGVLGGFARVECVQSGAMPKNVPSAYRPIIWGRDTNLAESTTKLSQCSL